MLTKEALARGYQGLWNQGLQTLSAHVSLPDMMTIWTLTKTPQARTGHSGSSPPLRLLPLSHSDVGHAVRLVDALEDAGNDLVGPDLVAALQPLIQQRLQRGLPLHR